MTDSDPSLDELASAYLDGVATPDERSRVEADPALLTRVEAFRRVRHLLADAPAPPAGQPDAILARVLASRALPRPEDELADRRSARRPRSVRVVAAAAAVLAVGFLAGALVLALRDREGHDTTAASSATSAPAALAGTGAAGNGGARTATDEGKATGAPAPEATAPSATGRELAAPIGDLGTFTDEQALRAAIPPSGRSPAVSAAGPTASPPASSCPTDASGSWYTARLDGRPVLVVVEPARVRVIDATSCALVAAFAR
jgi:hypothetical protein